MANDHSPTSSPQSDGWNLVVHGHFNAQILTPRFCAEHIAAGDVAVDAPHDTRLPPRLDFDGVSLVASDGRLVVAPRALDAEGLSAAENVAAKVMELLPHTPVTGAGVNLRWLLPHEGPAHGVLTLSDSDAVAALGAKVEQTVVRRRLILEGAKIELLIASGDVGTQVSVNFHHDAPSSGAVRDAIVGRTGALLEQASALVTKLYT